MIHHSITKTFFFHLLQWLFLVSILGAQVAAQNPNLGEVFKDDIVPRIDLLLPQDSLELMIRVGSQGSDQHFVSTMIFDNGEIKDTLERVGVRLRGNTSRDAQKKSFKISFNTYEPRRKFYGLEKLNINGEHNDPSIMRSKLSWDILRDIDIPAPRANHVQLYLNQQYVGLYINVEHIDEEFVEDRFGSQAGNLYKCTYPAPLTYTTDNPNDYTKEMWGRRPYELKTNTDEDDYSDLVNFIRILNDPTASDFACDLEQVFNVNDYLKVMAFDVLSSNWDGPIFNQNNFYLYHNPSSGQFEYIPFDLDNTFGIDWFIGDLATRNIYTWSQDPANRPIYTNLLQDPIFLNRYNYYLQEILATTFNPDKLYPYLDEKLALIKPFAEQDPFSGRDYGWSFSDFQDSYEMALGGHVEYGLKTYIQERHESAIAQLNISQLSPIIDKVQHSFPFPTLPLEIAATIFEDAIIPSVELCYTHAPTSPLQCMPMELEDSTTTYTTSLSDLTNHETLFYYIQVRDDAGLEQRYPYCGFQEINTNQSNLPLVINEFQAKNSSTISDQAGEFNDWIELYNAGEEEINLKDIYLTDNLDNPSKWALPSIRLAPTSYLLIWADEDQEQGPLHANFKLSSNGESIGLFEQAGDFFLPIDVVQYEAQQEDQAVGRLPNGIGEFTQLSPTPNKSNQPISTSIFKIDNVSILVSPNPASTYLNIVVKEQLPATLDVNIYNLQGQEVYSNKLFRSKDTSLLWSTGDLPRGVYVLQFKAEGEVVSYRKVVLQ